MLLMRTSGSKSVEGPMHTRKSRLTIHKVLKFLDIELALNILSKAYTPPTPRAAYAVLRAYFCILDGLGTFPEVESHLTDVLADGRRSPNRN